MSNFDRAVKVLNDVGEYIDYLEGNIAYVTALQSAGLLMPDLPEPCRGRVFKVASPYLDVSSVQAAENQIILHGYKTRHASISEARRLALALLAACEYAEKEQDNEC